jgi:hypothetical protein
MLEYWDGGLLDAGIDKDVCARIWLRRAEAEDSQVWLVGRTSVVVAYRCCAVIVARLFFSWPQESQAFDPPGIWRISVQDALQTHTLASGKVAVVEALEVMGELALIREAGAGRDLCQGEVTVLWQELLRPLDSLRGSRIRRVRGLLPRPKPAAGRRRRRLALSAGGWPWDGMGDR